MKVWIDGREHTGDAIVIKLSDQDKKNIASMVPEAFHYGMFNDELDDSVVKILMHKAAEDLK